MSEGAVHVAAPADPLTRLSTRDQVVAVLERWRDAGHAELHCMLIALDELSALNLAFGVTVGDRVLLETARRIAMFADDEFADEEALLGRLGGSSFFLAVRNGCTRQRWQWLAEALADMLAVPLCTPDTPVGIRLWPRVAMVRGRPGDTAGDLLDKAAAGLQTLRAAGVSRVGWADGSEGSFGASRRQLEIDLLCAIDRDEIGVVYQPVHAVGDGRVVGAEVLARWNHPEMGQLGASVLFTLAERADHVPQLSRHVIATALHEAAGWPVDVPLAVNVTAADIATGTFDRELLAIADGCGFAPERLTVELTEQALVRDLAQAREVLGRLEKRGVRIVLDDFGAGFCNFAYLKMLPLHGLKLDRSMLDDVVGNGRDRAVLRAILAMARALSLEVVAEGVETQAQLDVVRAEGCSRFQGYLASRPLTAAQLVRYAPAG
ncbi:GGDEF domain-containing protein [Erythrobacteraceae bacterium CFH 75059]|uniref:GGDEF domain-containing phosphodiesterase n=1 Tax=Qipengyuania thermophila TaxID=2509361 RepID=UPI001020C19F|nr:GGDEF domain-containing phosphodiesterase [Qipengyuania thermophila]TCD05065.1 GGDEF domain-containing protein [Erythrobacteraceae bacterium CFH 75059]